MLLRKSTPAPSPSSTGLPRIVAAVQAAAASKRLTLARLEHALLDALPEEGDEQELEHHFRDAIRWA